MKYTFLLPAFKGRFLDEMLRSIQGQTYRDFKVIISDDCSPEDLRSICEPYLADPRFTYRRNAENMGSKSLVSHWNLLVDMCDTEFLILASDDDVYEPQFLEEIDKLTVKYPKVDLFRARVQKTDGEGNILIKDGLFEEYTDQLHFIHQSLLNNHIQCIANYCFRTESLEGKGGFLDFPKAWASDDVTTMMMSEKGCCNTADIRFNFRQSDVNISAQWGDKKDSEAKTSAILLSHYWFKELIEKRFGNGYPEEPLLPNAVFNYRKFLLREILIGYVVNCRWPAFNHFAKECRKEFSMSYIYLLYNWLRKHINR